jgi:hypothetical protein
MRQPSMWDLAPNLGNFRVELASMLSDVFAWVMQIFM